MISPYLIAEIGVNHEGNLDLARKMIDQVAESGWNAAKFQTYTADLLASKKYSSAYWDTNEEPETSQYELFRKFRPFTDEDYDTLRNHCESAGVDFLTTAFDAASMSKFAPTMPYVKIASADITNVPLLSQAASYGKHMLVSCGAASIDEITTAVEIAQHGGGEVTLMHCILNYPTPVEKANLGSVLELKAKFPNLAVGYSDHTRYNPTSPLHPLVMAFLLGATVLEKHFTLDRTMAGNDHYHAADFAGLVSLKASIEEALLMFGTGIDESLTWQTIAREQARRRIFANKDIPKGSVLCAGDLVPLRASEGIPVSNWRAVIGSETSRFVAAGEPIRENDLQNN